jgi:predicted ATP-binding protein involved in virulence
MSMDELIVKTEKKIKSIPPFEWEVPDFAVLVGKNGSGKTQLLEIIRDSLTRSKAEEITISLPQWIIEHRGKDLQNVFKNFMLSKNIPQPLETCINSAKNINIYPYDLYKIFKDIRQTAETSTAITHAASGT